jgi:hypothetical protein
VYGNDPSDLSDVGVDLELRKSDEETLIDRASSAELPLASASSVAASRSKHRKISVMSSDTAHAGDALTRMLHAIDLKDWPGVRREFADTLDMDYTSLFGDPPIRIAADQQVAGWQRFASVFDATQHITGPILVSLEADGVVARTHVRAYHRIQGAPGGDVWMVAGHYIVKLTQAGNAWKIAGITLTTLYQEGNRRIPEMARARAAAT